MTNPFRFHGLALLAWLAMVSLTSSCASATSSAPAAPPGAPSANVPSVPLPGASGRQQWLEMFARGYFPGRSGQIFVIPREGDVITDRDPLYGFMHGSPWEYDVHIPLLLHGAPFVKPGEHR